jgi:hypothetical protein
MPKFGLVGLAEVSRKCKQQFWPSFARSTRKPPSAPEPSKEPLPRIRPACGISRLSARATSPSRRGQAERRNGGYSSVTRVNA